MTTNLIKLTIFVIIYSLSQNIFADPQKKESIKSINEDGFQKVAHGYSFVYHKCWDVIGSDDQPDDVEDRTIHSTQRCPIAEYGTWSMGIDYGAPAVSIDDFLLSARRDSRFVYDSKVSIDGSLEVVIEKLEQEKYPLIERRDQTNLNWSVIMRCGKKNMTIGYADHLDKPAREKARKDHSIPPVFKEFLAGFKCDKK